MKKQILVLSAVVLAAFTMQSCLTKALGDVKKIAKELEEVTSGDVFQIPAATITFSDGVLFAFKDYGRYQYIETADDIEIRTPNAIYYCDKDDKTYYMSDYDSETYGYTSEFVVLEEALKAEAYWDKYDKDENITKQDKVICGKTCTAFVDEDGDVVASWKRIRMYEKSTDDEVVEATTLTESAVETLFSVPAGYVLE